MYKWHIQTQEDIEADFRKRIAFYESAYASLDGKGAEADSSYMKIEDLGESIQLHNVRSRLSHRCVRFLMNVKIGKRTIYLSRHGESLFNVAKRIGGDSELSQAGIKYSVALKAFMRTQELPYLKVWTSSLQRTIQTAALFENIESFKALDELNAGQCEGLTYEQIRVEHPKVTEQRSTCKYYYRYPRGESYKDVVDRLEPLIVDLEREDHVLVVAHQAVCRCLLAYFQNIPTNALPKELPFLEVPLHTVLKVTPLSSPGEHGCKIEKFTLGPDAVNTHLPQSRPASADTDHPKC